MGDFTATVQRMSPGEEGRVCRLIQQVFNQFVAPLYGREGVEEFMRYADPTRMAERNKGDHCTLLAKYGDEIVGVIEVRDFNHIPLLFVAADAQRKGIAKLLLGEAVQRAHRVRPKPLQITVHASPNAVDAYGKMGFQSEGGERLEQGIRYVPMRLKL